MELNQIRAILVLKNIIVSFQLYIIFNMLKMIQITSFFFILLL